MKEILVKIWKVIKALMTRRICLECDRVPYQFSNVPLKKILNWILVEASIFFKPQSPWGLPTHLQIEPANFCNLKCVFCPVTTGLGRPSGKMDFNVFRKLIDETGDFVFIILLWDWGEPTLNPAIYEMIKYAKKRGIKTVLSSNLKIFTEKRHAESLVSSGLDSVICAVDGISQDTYNRYRRCGDLNVVLEGLKNIVKAKENMNSSLPLVNLRFIPMKHNEHEIPFLHDFAASIGVDALTLKTLNPYDGGECSSNNAEGNAFLPMNPAYRRFRYYPGTQSRIRRKRNPCKTLWNNPTIHWNGNVCPCSFDPHDRYVMGNLKRSSFADIWSGESYRNFRNRFRRDYKMLPACTDCTYAFEGGSCNNEIIIDTYFFNHYGVKKWSHVKP